MKIRNITVIGANGALGVGVSSIFASFGNCKVNMVARTMEKANKAIEDAGKSVKAYSVCSNMRPYTYDNLEECIKESDFVIETIIEDLKEKQRMHKMINKYSTENTIVSSVTSGISINELADCYDNDKRTNFFGIHFFNPPYSLTLCELIPSKYAKKEIVEQMKEFLEKELIRKVIIVKDEPAFLANRIGFQFINMAIQYAEKYKDKGGIDYIDTILGCYTGRAMQPLRTADFVGLDVHKAIVDNVYNNTNDFCHETFELPVYVDELIDNGMLGIKSGKGFYCIEDNIEKVYDIETDEYIEKKKFNIDFIEKVIKEFKIANYGEGISVLLNDKSEEANICRNFLVNYIIYSIVVSKEIAENVTDCDIAMAEGFNWIPPFALIELIGEDNVKSLAKQYNIEQYEIVEKVLDEKNKSEYRYEKFLKAKVL